VGFKGGGIAKVFYPIFRFSRQLWDLKEGRSLPLYQKAQGFSRQLWDLKLYALKAKYQSLQVLAANCGI